MTSRHVAASLPPWLPDRLERLTEHCRAVADTDLGVGLPPVELEVGVVAPADEIVRTDYVRRVWVGVSGPDRVVPPPAGANLVYALAHEVGHMVTVRRLPAGAGLPVVWDEAFAHLLAVDVFFPSLEDRFGTDVWPGETAGWQGRQAALGPELSFAGQEGQLARCTGALRSTAEAVGGVAGLLTRLPDVPRRDLGILRIERALARLRC